MTEYYLNLEWKAGKADSEYREQLRKAVTAEESAVYRCARWAASEQEAFTGSVLWLLSGVGKQQVSLLGRAWLGKDGPGVVLTGGCSLNLMTNERIRQHMAQQLGARVRVASAPHDAGLAVGGAWMA